MSKRMSVGRRSVLLPLVAVAAFWGSTPARAQWVEHSVTDHLLGKVGIGVSATGQIIDERGRKHVAQLTVNCSKNSTTVTIGGDGLFIGSSGGGGQVAWTLDDGPVQQARWSICASNQCAGLWNGAGIPFVKSLFDKSLLKITIQRYDGQQLRGDFIIGRAKEAMEPVGKPCGWLPK